MLSWPIATKNISQEILAYNNLASIYCKPSNDVEKAIYYAEKGLDLANRNGIFDYNFTLYINTGLAYLAKGEPELTLSYFLKAYEYLDYAYPKLHAALLRRTGEVLTILGRYDEAREHTLQGIDVARSSNSLSNLSKAYIHLSYIDSIQGNYQAALMNYKLGISARDSIWNTDRNSRIAELQIIHDTEIKKIK